VIDELRKDDDMGLETRREMVDLKEREADAAAERAAAERQAVADQERQIAQDRAAAVAERDAIAQDRQADQEAAAAGRLTREEQQSNEEQLAAREEAAAEKEAAADKQEEALAAQREEAAQAEQFAGDKADEARQERQDIAQDQQTIIDQGERPAARTAAQADTAAETKIVGVKLGSADSPLGRLVQMNAASGAELRTGDMNTVNARSLTQVGGTLFIIAGENRGAIRLVGINPNTLETTAQGTDDIHPQSLIWQNGNSLFAITVSGGRPHFARFNTNLTKAAESAITVHAYGTPTFQGNVILIQREDGSAAVLNAGDLTERR
jgi:hypothetical protein